MSRKVILYIAQSLDGRIADCHGKVDWLNEAPAQDDAYASFISGIDTVILGHRTYQQIRDELAPAIWPYAGMQSYVLTHHDELAQEGICFVCQPVTALIHALKQTQGKDIWICGGSDVIDQCVRADLIDEYHIATLPLILGGGMPLFKPDGPMRRLKLLRAGVDSDMVSAVYVRERESE